MENYMGMKLKRKELEEVNHDFSDFSLSSPARKIRRLDVDLPPIIEEEEAEIPLGYEQSTLESAISNGMGHLSKQLVIDELQLVPENEEKAIVLFKPVKSSVVYSPCNLFVDSNLISCFKNQALWDTNLNTSRPSEEDEAISEANTCKAVTPWVPSQHFNQRPVLVSQPEISESMEAEEMDATTMEIEDIGTSNVGQPSNEYSNHSRASEALRHQWHQQHCMIPQPPQNTAFPIVWYR